MLFFWTFYSLKKPEKILLRCFQHNNNNKCFFCLFFEQQIRILEWFLKDHVTGVMVQKNSFEITGINYILKYIQIESSYFK